MALHDLSPWMLLLLLAAAIWAGAQNALAGGGSFITLPALILSGLDARAANITSTVALFPGQVTTGWAGRSLASGAENLSLRTLIVISLAGGAVGALLLLLTPPSFFEGLLPWLVLFATAAFAWGSFRRRPETARALKPAQAMALQFAIAIYGGYFGGGIGFLMLAVLSLAKLPVRAAAATKNVLAGVMNGTAVLVFLFSGEVRWVQAATLAVGAIGGGLAGAWLLRRANEKILRLAVIAIGVILTVGLFIRAYR
ncbi:sulfite exporter TauE/SafE family protein [Phenylobacterium sp.]|uniref:sulfite exporter TauE/SafE family protein n=1 Tax=Phenylobacterium sp. TaxID=1871053 RepID=UPI002E380A1B|nr:sulfite exporter TauE/SafE family protein [Phenylobacterium sp.]HEX3366410.1 sulfite exporter TauE/SafE family protein [Phenylobacterium sp.]